MEATGYRDSKRYSSKLPNAENGGTSAFSVLSPPVFRREFSYAVRRFSRSTGERRVKRCLPQKVSSRKLETRGSREMRDDPRLLEILNSDCAVSSSFPARRRMTENGSENSRRKTGRRRTDDAQFLKARKRFYAGIARLGGVV